MAIKIVVFLLLFLSSFNGDKPVSWNEKLKLSWNDFRGPAKLNTNAVAVTASGITFSYSLKKTNNKIVDFEAFVQAHFYPENSWYIKDKSDEYILAHEQLHFDITELHVRKFRKRLNQVKVSQSVKAELDQMHQDAQNELREMQLRYDKESQNSINKEFQSNWKDFVHQQLDIYKEYKSK